MNRPVESRTVTGNITSAVWTVITSPGFTSGSGSFFLTSFGIGGGGPMLSIPVVGRGLGFGFAAGWRCKFRGLVCANTPEWLGSARVFDSTAVTSATNRTLREATNRRSGTATRSTTRYMLRLRLLPNPRADLLLFLLSAIRRFRISRFTHRNSHRGQHPFADALVTEFCYFFR